MQGFQFANMSTWSEKGSKGSDPRDPLSRKKSGDRDWTTSEILDEAVRAEGACDHVVRGPLEPEIVPGSMHSISELRESLAAITSRKEPVPYTNKDGSIGTRMRKLRRDAPSLHTVIISLPVDAEAALADPALAQECRDLLGKAMAHESKRIASLGGETALGVIHFDERQVHAHLYSIDRERRGVGHLHPGRAAKDAYHANPPDGVTGKKKTKAANEAYCAAMRDWQDDFHEQVFRDAGLLRVGPKKERLTRRDYHKRTKAQERHALEREQQRALAAEIDLQEAELAEILRSAEIERREEQERRVALGADMVDLLVRENNIGGREALADQALMQSNSIAEGAEAFQTAADRGLAALEAREMEHRPATEPTKEGLRFGPAAPKDPAWRRALGNAVRPAYDWLVRIARRYAGLEAREAKLAESEGQIQQRAKVLINAQKRADQAIEPALQALGLGEPLPTTVDSFPGAWAISADENAQDLATRVNALTNWGMREAWGATHDATILSSDAGADDVAAQFRRGQTVLERMAESRGLDLATGKHDPAAATDKSKARLHTDQADFPLQVIRRDQQRVLVRS